MPADISTATVKPPQADLRQRLMRSLIDYGMVWALIVILIAATIAYPGFFAIPNLRNILGQSAPVGIVAVGMTFVIIAGGLDFSVGAIFALAAVLFAMTADALGLWGAAIAVILASLACGVVNGFVITRLKVSPFVATLGTGSIFGGLAYIVSNSAPQSPMNFGYDYLGIERWFGIPVAGWIMVAVFVAGAFILARTSYGQSIYAAGGNAEAARLSGIPVNLITASTYLISAACAGFGGMILSSRLGVGQADMGGTVSLDSIAVVVIGGTSLLGGEGAMWRTAIGLATIATLTNVFDSLAVSTSYQLVIKGAIVVLAVAFDVFARSRRG
jgi:ribose transport system permease protein